MSQEKNVEIVRAALGAMADADLDELLRHFHPEIEYLPLTHAQVARTALRCRLSHSRMPRER